MTKILGMWRLSGLDRPNIQLLIHLAPLISHSEFSLLVLIVKNLNCVKKFLLADLVVKNY